MNQATMPQQAAAANGSACARSMASRPVLCSAATAAVQVTMRVGFTAVIRKPRAKLRLRPLCRGWFWGVAPRVRASSMTSPRASSSPEPTVLEAGRTIG